MPRKYRIGDAYEQLSASTTRCTRTPSVTCPLAVDVDICRFAQHFTEEGGVLFFFEMGAEKREGRWLHGRWGGVEGHWRAGGGQRELSGGGRRSAKPWTPPDQPGTEVTLQLLTPGARAPCSTVYCNLILGPGVQSDGAARSNTHTPPGRRISSHCFELWTATSTSKDKGRPQTFSRVTKGW